MQGLLADVDVDGHLPYLRRLLESRDLWVILVEFNLRLVTFRDLQFQRNLDLCPALRESSMLFEVALRRYD